MLLSELIEKLKIDTGLTEIAEATANRAFERAVTQVNKDLETAYECDDTQITPEPSSLHQELFLILAAWFLAHLDLVSASKMVTSWKSGDKQVDRSRQMLTKKEIHDDLWSMYRDLAGLDDDPEIAGGVQYEQESQL